MMLVLILTGYALYAQETESKTVEFVLNNMADTESPSIKILSPILNDKNHINSRSQSIELIGEVLDESKVKFVSINTEIKILNESGIFAINLSLQPGENLIHIKSMDENDNLTELVLIAEFNPSLTTLSDRIRKDSKYYGLIIGIDDYTDPGIPDLENPVKDACNVYRSLVSNYTFEAENVTLLENPQRYEIIKELDEMSEKIGPEDNLVIFYAGHGYWDEDAEIGYWLPSDATRETTADWFRNSTLVDYLQAIHSKHTLLITDACFAGSIFKARSVSLEKELIYDRIYEIPSRKAMTSGAFTEVPDKSAFVKYLIKRLDENNKTYLSSEELFSSFKMAVISNSSVLPQYGEIQNVGNEGGDFIFLKRE